MIAVPWWWLAAIILMVATGCCFVAALRGSRLARLSALQLSTTTTALALLAMIEATGRSSYITVPLGISVISIPGTLIIAHAVQRWSREDPCEP